MCAHSPVPTAKKRTLVFIEVGVRRISFHTESESDVRECSWLWWGSGMNSEPTGLR